VIFYYLSLLFRAFLFFIDIIFSLRNNFVQEFITYAGALPSKDFLQVVFGDVAFIVCVEVMECKSQIFLCQCSLTIYCCSKEFWIIYFTTCTASKFLKQLMNLVLINVGNVVVMSKTFFHLFNCDFAAVRCVDRSKSFS